MMAAYNYLFVFSMPLYGFQENLHYNLSVTMELCSVLKCLCGCSQRKCSEDVGKIKCNVHTEGETSRICFLQGAELG